MSDAEEQLVGAKAALEAFDDTLLNSEEFKAATAEYNAAYEAWLNPYAEYKALMAVRDAKLDAMRASFNEYEAL